MMNKKKKRSALFVLFIILHSSFVIFLSCKPIRHRIYDNVYLAGGGPS